MSENQSCVRNIYFLFVSYRRIFFLTTLAQTAAWLQAASSWPLAVFACLLGEFGFFCLGHQTTLSAIPWAAAFSVFAGDHGTTVLPASLVLSHTFAAQILVTLALPLLVVWTFRQLCSKSKSAELLLFQSESNLTELRDALDRLMRRYLIAHFVLVRSSSSMFNFIASLYRRSTHVFSLVHR